MVLDRGECKGTSRNRFQVDRSGRPLRFFFLATTTSKKNQSCDPAAGRMVMLAILMTVPL
jgi:hypothetical protein